MHHESEEASYGTVCLECPHVLKILTNIYVCIPVYVCIFTHICVCVYINVLDTMFQKSGSL